MSALWTRWPSLVAAALLTAVCGTLMGSLGYQFILGELPCPLCVLQRLSFLLACFGPLGILLDKSPQPSLRHARGFAFTIVAALVGAAVSTRQIFLHIVPPDPGYGPPVLGLHLYTWALIVFVCLILGSAVGLFGLGDDKEPLPRPVRQILAVLVVTLTVLVAVFTFSMEGFAWLLPDDPQRYELLRQIGLRP